MTVSKGLLMVQHSYGLFLNPGVYAKDKKNSINSERSKEGEKRDPEHDEIPRLTGQAHAWRTRSQTHITSDVLN
jgi:hypothetical protein